MKKIYYVPIFGITGVGKSQLCNFLFKDLSNSKYKVGHSNKMQTTIKDLKNLDEKGLPILEDEFCLIDLPGGNDSKTDDLKNLENIAKFLQNKGRVDCILLVFNFTTRNEEKSTKEYLKKLSSMFTQLEFFSHVIIILSNYPLKPRKSEVKKRDTYMSEINNLIIECFELKDRKEIENKKLNYYFIDTLPAEDEDGNQFYTEIQLDTRDAIIKEMNLICKRNYPGAITKITFDEKQKELKANEEKEKVKEFMDKMNKDPQTRREVIDKITSDKKMSKDFMESLADKQVNRTNDNDELCCGGKIGLGILTGLGILVAAPVVAVGGIIYGLSEVCNIF